MKKIAITTGLFFELSDFAIQKMAERKGVVVYPETRKYDVFFWTVPEDKWMREPELENHDNDAWDAFGEYEREHSWIDKVTQFGRDDSDLISIIEEFGSEVVSGENSEIRIVEIPDDVDWCIASCDETGGEWVEERKRSWSYEPKRGVL